MKVLPNLDEMTDVEAIRWYTAEVAKLMKNRELKTEYGLALLEWKKQMNKRLEENRKEILR
jgi:hypothetical protein